MALLGWGEVRLRRSIRTVDGGWREPTGGLHGHALGLRLRLRRSRIKILMATSSRCVGRGGEEWTLVN